MKTVFFQFAISTILFFSFTLNEASAQGTMDSSARVSVDMPAIIFRMSMVPTGMLKCKCVLKNPTTGDKVKIREVLPAEELEKFYKMVAEYRRTGYTLTKKYTIKKQQKILFQFGKNMPLE